MQYTGAFTKSVLRSISWEGLQLPHLVFIRRMPNFVVPIPYRRVVSVHTCRRRRKIEFARSLYQSCTADLTTRFSERSALTIKYRPERAILFFASGVTLSRYCRPR